MLHLLVPLAVTLALSLLYQVAAKNNQSSDWPKGLVAYGSLFRYLVYFFWFCVAGFLVFGFVEGPNSRGELTAGICGLLAFSVLVLVMHLEFLSVKIEYNDEGIQTTSPWRPQRHIPWSDVSSVRFSQASQWYVVKTTNSGSVRCHVYLSGLKEFLAELNERGYNLSQAHPYGKPAQ